MAEMVRKQIYISKRQELILKRLSKARGVSEAAIIREAIDREMAQAVLYPGKGDDEGWEKLVRLMRSMDSEIKPGQQPYQWRREDAYEGRLGHYFVKDAREDASATTQETDQDHEAAD